MRKFEIRESRFRLDDQPSRILAGANRPSWSAPHGTTSLAAVLFDQLDLGER